MPKMTMTEFAEKIGVHYATVSRVYNNKPGVGKTKRQFVFEQAELLGFHPNTSARGLKMQRSFAIGMVTPGLLNAYWGELLLEVQRCLEPENYGLLVSPCSREKGETLRAIRFLMRHGVDALIVSSDNYTMQGEEEEILKLAQTAKIPIILLVTNWESSPFPFIGNDVPADMQLACNHLLGLGHTQIAVMASEAFNPGSARRIEGCLAALENVGLSAQNLQILHGGYKLADGEQAAQEWLALEDRPTAVIASTDPASIGLYRALHGAGIRVPEDVSVVGYGDSSDIDLLSPPLTTVAHPFKELARVTADRLLEQMDTPTAAAENLYLPGQLMVRESCKQIP